MGHLIKELGETYYLQRTPPSIFQPAWEARTEYLKSLIREYHAEGVIWYQLCFEEIYDMECSIVSKAMDELQIPFLRIESSYEFSREAMAPLRTRVESFIESIKIKTRNLKK
jgi:benzoyl-CoA reductase/2-hydroxyglutaryl-CoA dehydratase subunit BcrC/BadD/HgdB